MSGPTGFPFGLIATDLDGTLLRSDGTVSPRTRKAIRAGREAGAMHIVVTGRGVPWTRPVLDALGYTGLAVCGQGAQLYDAGAHRLLTSVTLDREVARRAVAVLESELGPLWVAASRDGLDGAVIVDPAGFAVEPARDGALPTLTYTDRAELWAEPLAKLYLRHPGLGDDELAGAAHELVGESVGIVMAGPGTVELLPLGLSKATGLSMAGRRLGVRGDETIAFGDMPNDIPMFGWSAHGVAMGDAHPELRAVADEVTSGCDEDGIAEVIERLLRF
ncbi:HAD family hydrolase [Streptomyces calidiresistens]|uniref:Cof-type HAD-IIB family hydrolase n=1 Tax=Streptomyces calidiresistens TaxID=1485586 RepID=A0A7W3T3G5_9ACTN|nr:Cof-type HAD-IIB family hydrolase [Streptomyces calidiresistens]MBB0230239.1 Cof-type HAD-IIB family hydrolase [Streptomyces calidiresistens]